MYNLCFITFLQKTYEASHGIIKIKKCEQSYYMNDGRNECTSHNTFCDAFFKIIFSILFIIDSHMTSTLITIKEKKIYF